jgi:hypothetical protein
MKQPTCNAGPGMKRRLAATRSGRSEPSPVADPHSTVAGAGSWLGVAGLLLLFASVWTIVRPYAGLVHDARLYAAQTAAKLHPEIFAQDLFLRYGSQDNFTIFPRLFAPLAYALGMESAAAVLTLVASLAWLGLGYLIARELSGTRLALMALGMLVVVPGWYGAHEVFRIGEMFLSARLPAEVFALGGLLAYLRGRYGLAAGSCTASALVHPLMAIPMIGLLTLAVVHRGAGPSIARAAVLALVISASVVTIVLPTAPIEHFEAWVSVLETRSAFLFPSLWRPIDWQYHIMIFVTLFIGSRIGSNARNRDLALCAAWVGGAGVVLAMIAASWPEHPALLRAQTWRWVWVACLLALVMLPQIVHELWQRGSGTTERAVAVLLAAAWLLPDSVGGLLTIVALAILLWAGGQTGGHSVWATRASWAAFSLALGSIAVMAVQFAAYPLDSNREPMWVQRVVNAVGPTSSALVIVAVCWWAALREHGRRLASAIAVLAVALSVVALPRAVRDWSTLDYSGAAYNAFAPWRSIIPAEAEVLWPGDAVATWLVLDRRSYFSPDQLAGLLYSPGMTPELQRRARALTPLVSPDWWTMADLRQEAKPKDLTVDILVQVCRAPGLDFVVSDQNLGFAVSTVRRPVREIDLYLYDCRAPVPRKVPS